MKYTAAVLFLSSVALIAQQSPLYSSKDYTLYPDKVVQGQWESKAISSTELISNYQNTAYLYFPRQINFKLSINLKDNEMASGLDHHIYINDGQQESPIITFGKQLTEKSPENSTYLPSNYNYTFRVDFRKVLEDFKAKGFYTTYTGEKIFKEDFKGLYIAGESAPLTWDFPNLKNKDLELKDEDGDGIYEITLTFNQINSKNIGDKVWKASQEIKNKPSYSSSQPIVDALFRLSTEEANNNVESDGTLRTGLEWAGVWTRDISYSIYLAFAMQQTDAAINSLKRKVKDNRIIQDTGSGGAYPVSSDRIVWAVAAWEIYKYTGDKNWLSYAYNVIKNTLDDDYKNVYDFQTGLFRGESSFLDWREQTYPKWMNNADIYNSQNLGTNAVFYKAHVILADMSKILESKKAKEYEKKADDLKQAINKHFWISDRGFYGQYLYGKYGLSLSPRLESLGEALSIIFGIADQGKSEKVISHAPTTVFGVTCIYPQIPKMQPYHNNAIWPFVQAYYNLASAQSNNETVLSHGMASIFRPAALFLTNYENMVADTGDYYGTAINSSSMLWSMAGNLAMVYRVLIGLQFETDYIKFSPKVPKAYDGTKELKNFHYRNAILDIKVQGFGSKIKEFRLDGKLQKKHIFSGALSGHHTIEIVLDNQTFLEKENMQPNRSTLEMPNATIHQNMLSWEPITGAVKYLIYKNGKQINTVDNHELKLDSTTAEYSVSAIDENNWESFKSEPVWANIQNKIILEVEDVIDPSNKKYSGFSGRGFVETSTSENTNISLPVSVSEEGDYLFTTIYSNGTGPWNTDNNCAMRSLYVNGNYNGVIVMPQRGQDEWSNWGQSNSIKIHLKKGENILKFQYNDWNKNMDGEINEAMLDYVQLIKL